MIQVKSDNGKGVYCCLLQIVGGALRDKATSTAVIKIGSLLTESEYKVRVLNTM